MPGGKNQKGRKPTALGEPAKHVLVRMPVELHKRIVKIAKSHRVPRSFNTELVELLYEFTDWWGRGEEKLEDVEIVGKRMLAIDPEELTGKKLLSIVRSARAHKKVPWKK
jgi:hypothetical protein